MGDLCCLPVVTALCSSHSTEGWRDRICKSQELLGSGVKSLKIRDDSFQPGVSLP